MITRVNSIRMASSRIAGEFHDVTICCMWAGKEGVRAGMGKRVFCEDGALHGKTITASVK